MGGGRKSSLLSFHFFVSSRESFMIRYQFDFISEKLYENIRDSWLCGVSNIHKKAITNVMLFVFEGDIFHRFLLCLLRSIACVVFIYLYHFYVTLSTMVSFHLCKLHPSHDVWCRRYFAKCWDVQFYVSSTKLNGICQDSSWFDLSDCKHWNKLCPE